MTALLVWLLVAIAQTLVMCLAWLTQRLVNNVGWVDVFWTYATGAGSVLCALLAGHAGSPHAILLAAMSAVWSLRLGTYVAVRVARASQEDVRYRTFRTEWGVDFQRRMFRFIVVQGPIAAILSGCVMLASNSSSTQAMLARHASEIAGLLVYATGLCIETLADRQLQSFRTTAARGALCDSGLWGRSRHPNYFGEFLVWCAVPVIAIGGDPGRWTSWLTLAAPALIYWLVVHVSGIPPLERAMAASRGQAWQDYAARVPAFIPTASFSRRSVR